MDETVTASNLEALASHFRRFGAESRGSSPLYEHLALSIAADEELVALTASTPPGQPVPNLLLAAVHFLLLQGHATPLAQFYPSLEDGTISQSSLPPRGAKRGWPPLGVRHRCPG